MIRRRREIEVRILDRGRGGKLGIVTTARGLVFACTWSPDTALTEEEVRDAFENNRRDFQAFNESSGCYLSGGRS